MPDWGVSAISAEFDGAGKGLGLARQELAEAAEHADSAAAWMAAGKLRGVAEGIGQIKTRLERDRAQLGTVADSLQQPSSAVATITDRSTPDEVIATLAPVQEAIGDAMSAIGRATMALNSTDILIRSNLAGGKPGRLLAYVTRATGILHAVRTHLAEATAATDRSLHQAREAGSTAGPARHPSLSPELAPPTGTDARVGDPLPDPTETPDARLAGALESRDEPTGPSMDEAGKNLFRRASDALARRADDAGQKAGQAAEFMHKGLTIRSPDLRPPGHTTAGTVQHAGTPAVKSDLQQASVPEVTQAVFVTAIAVIKGVEWGYDRVVEHFKGRKRDH